MHYWFIRNARLQSYQRQIRLVTYGIPYSRCWLYCPAYCYGVR